MDETEMDETEIQKQIREAVTPRGKYNVDKKNLFIGWIECEHIHDDPVTIKKIDDGVGVVASHKAIAKHAVNGEFGVQYSLGLMDMEAKEDATDKIEEFCSYQSKMKDLFHFNQEIFNSSLYSTLFDKGKVPNTELKDVLGFAIFRSGFPSALFDIYNITELEDAEDFDKIYRKTFGGLSYNFENFYPILSRDLHVGTISEKKNYHNPFGKDERLDNIIAKQGLFPTSEKILDEILKNINSNNKDNSEYINSNPTKEKDNLFPYMLTGWFNMRKKEE